MTDFLFRWQGKDIENLDRDELLKVVKHLSSSNASMHNSIIDSQQRDIDALRKENERLWKCLGNR